MLAAKLGTDSDVKALIELGADYNATNKQKSTALMVAASEGKTENCRALLYAGANKDAVDAAKLGAADYADGNEHKALADAIRNYVHKEPEPEAPEQTLDEMLQGLKDSKEAAVQQIEAAKPAPKPSKSIGSLNERLKRGGLID